MNSFYRVLTFFVFFHNFETFFDFKKFSPAFCLHPLITTATTSITHMNTHPYNGHLSGTTWVGRYQNKHSPTHTHPVHQTSFINFLHLLRSIASSLLIYVLDGLFSTIFFPQHIQVLFGLPLCLLVWNPLLHTPYISSRSHYLLFATHAHTITASSAVVPVLCRLFSADMCDCVVSQWQLLAVCE